MKQFDELKQYTDTIKLTDGEKASMRAHITAHMKSNPIKVEKSVPSPYFVWFRIVQQHGFATALVLLFCLVGVSSVSAESTLPGDALYGVKTGINERVLGWFANSPDAKAQWQLALADRRLEESETLARENKLTPELKTALRSEFSDHADNALGRNASREATAFSVSVPAESLQSVQAESEHESEAPTLMRAKAVVSMRASIATSSITKEKIATFRDEVIRAKKDVERQKKALLRNKQFIQAKGTVLESQKLIFDSEEALKDGNADEALKFYMQAQQELRSHTENIQSQSEVKEVESE